MMDKLTEALGRPPTTIAIFRALKLGDLLCCVPAFRALRAAFPNAHIALISLPWASEFVGSYRAYLDEFIPFPGWPGLPEQPLDPAETIAFLQAMQSRRWDVVLQLQGNGTLVNVMVSLLKAKIVAGYYRPDIPSERWIGEQGFFQPYPDTTHEIKRHVGLLTFLGIAPQGYDLEFTPTETDRREARHLLTRLGVEPGRVVCLHTGGISGRRWPEANFATIANQLAQRGYTILFTGTAGDQDTISNVQASLIHPAISIAGQTTLRLLGAILGESSLLISNDTGVAHLAIACGVPSVVVFTSADPAEWGPLQPNRHRVVREQEPYCRERVLAEALDLLAIDT